MADISKVNVGGTLYDIKDATARTDLLSKLSDAPSDGEEYVRKNGQWAVPSGGNGGVSAMYFYQQTVNVASSAEIMRITDPRINTNSIILECTFADPSYITSDVTWTSYAGYMAFTGTCTTATTANVTIGYTSNDNFSDRLMTLLWENPNPSGNFAAQTISINLSSYDFLMLRVKGSNYSNEHANLNDYIIVEKGVTRTINEPTGAYANTNSTNKYFNSRDVSFTDIGVTFSIGYSRQWNTTSANSGSADSYACIPLEIYGISRYNYFQEFRDTEWHNLDVNGKVVYRRSGQIVNVIMPSADIASGSTNYGYLPEGYRPPTTIWAITDTGSSMAISTDGRVSTNRTSSTAWFAANLTYIGQ